MPLTSDDQILATAGDIVKQLQAIFGAHPGFRPAHAKGIILSGTFTPSPEAPSYTKAPHFNSESTPVWVRFSNSTGIPNIPDNDSHAAPRGIALRFQLGNRKHTDIIAHSTPFFPAQDGQQFLDLFRAIAATTPDSPHPTPIEAFLGAHPAALKFVTAPKPDPASYATDRYWGINAYKLISADGKETFIRWSIVPEAGIIPYDTETLKDADADYLQKELPGRLAEGPIVFKVVAQIAEEGDVVTDATVHWPAERKVVEFGTVKLEAIVEDHMKESKYAIFDPIPRVEGVEASEDPLLELRAAVYLMSGRERRHA